MTIYFGNVPYDCTEAQLFDLLEPFDAVCELTYPIDRVTRQHRGFAFVTLADQEVAEAVIGTLNGTEINGRAIRVTEAKATERAPSKGIPVGFRKQGDSRFGFGGPGRR